MATKVSFEQARLLLTPPAPSPVCYDLNEVETHFGVRYTPEQRDALAGIPFSEQVLRESVGTHMLFPGFPLSLLDVRDKHAALFYSKKGGWYAEEKHAFSRARVPVRWHLLRMEPVPKSFGKTWKEQQTLLGPDEEVPSAAVVAFATMLHFRMTGQRLFKSCYVRTSDVGSDGYRVDVGYFDAGGLYVYRDWDAYRYDSLGLASARKF